MSKTSKTPQAAVTLAFGALLAGCASTPAGPNQSKQMASPKQDSAVTLAQTDIQCVRERKTGTHMFTKVCTTAEQRRKREEESQALMQKARRPSDTTRSYGGYGRDK